MLRTESKRLNKWFNDEVSTRIKCDSNYEGIVYVSCKEQRSLLYYKLAKYDYIIRDIVKDIINFTNGARLRVRVLRGSISAERQAYDCAGLTFVTVAYTGESLEQLDDSYFHLSYMRSRLRTKCLSIHPRLSII